MPLKKKRPKKRLTKKRAIKRRMQKRRLPKKKILRKKITTARKTAGKKEKEKVIGIVTHYFPKVRAAVVKLKAPLAAGDRIRIKGHTTDFTQTATSLQIDRVPINSAQKGQEIGLLVESRVRQHDTVYKP